MSDPVISNPPPTTTTVDPNAPTPKPPEQTAAPTTTTPPEPKQNKGSGKNVTFPEHALKRMKDEERAKGEKAALGRQNAEAQKLGFKDHASLMASVAANKPKPQQPPKPKPEDASAAPTGDVAAMEKRLKQLESESRKNLKLAETERSQRKELSRKVRLAQSRADAVEAETDIRIASVRLGAAPEEVDFIVYSMRQHIKGRDEAFLNAFDEQKWLADLKATKPNLFNSGSSAPAPKVPATTGPTTNQVPPKADPSAPPRFDAMKATKAELEAHYRKIGRSMPQV